MLTYEDLRICASLIREANDITERIARLEALAERCTAQIREDASGGGSYDPMGDSAAKLADMREEGKRRTSAYLKHAALVDAAITEMVTDSDQRTVIRCRYLDGMGWEEVSEKTHFSRRWCFVLHDRGMESIGLERKNGLWGERVH